MGARCRVSQFGSLKKRDCVGGEVDVAGCAVHTDRDFKCDASSLLKS